ncbi:MAG: hypothetical protein HY537_16195 [Deltaproteobacteria bacterium]|nr:hypothetical protein [Deltaproteobacteria bacterium]
MDKKKFFTDVFGLSQGEVVCVLSDFPKQQSDDSPAWKEIRSMAQEWHQTFGELGKESGFKVFPLFLFPSTHVNGGELPLDYTVDGATLDCVLSQSTLAVALTQFSASAALGSRTLAQNDFRVASLPGVARRMERTALAADYSVVHQRSRILGELFNDAIGGEVQFATGHECYFDLRFRKAFCDDGQLPRNKKGFRLINLPSGETCITPYEGERPNTPSLTQGQIPAEFDGEILVLDVEANRIRKVTGPHSIAQKWQHFFDEDEARTNIAEFAFGCNPKAVVWGNILEDEKAGFHWAFGRSDHLGGTMKASDFRKNAIHEDKVYAKGSKIGLKQVLLKKQTETIDVIKESNYVCF